MDPKPVETVEVPWEAVPADTLSRLIEAYVLREGTDYGTEEALLPTKIAQVRRQLEEKSARLLFLPEDESFAIVPAEKPKRHR